MKKRVARLGVGALLVAWVPAAGGCGETLRLAPTGQPPKMNAEFVIVDYPPPPAEAESIGRAPDEARCVWVDGHYGWEGRRWNWEHGGWYVAPEGCYYSVPTLRWQSGETDVLYYAPPRWYPQNADELPRQSALSQCQDIEPCRTGGGARQ